MDGGQARPSAFHPLPGWANAHQSDVPASWRESQPEGVGVSHRPQGLRSWQRHAPIRRFLHGHAHHDLPSPQRLTRSVLGPGQAAQGPGFNGSHEAFILSAALTAWLLSGCFDVGI